MFPCPNMGMDMVGGDDDADVIVSFFVYKYVVPKGNPTKED